MASGTQALDITSLACRTPADIYTVAADIGSKAAEQVRVLQQVVPQ